jgi:hypothetical protein
VEHSWEGTWWGTIILEIASDAIWLALIAVVAVFGFWFVAHERQNRLNRFFGPGQDWDGKIRIRLSNVYVVPYGTRSFAGRDIGAFGPAATTGEFRAATAFEKEMYRPAQRSARLLGAIAGELGGERGRNAARPVRCEIRPSPMYFEDHGSADQVPGYQVVDDGVPYQADFQGTGMLAKRCLDQLREGSLVVAGSDVYNMLSGFLQFREYQKTGQRMIWWKRVARNEFTEDGKHGENMTERVLMVRKDCTLVGEPPEEDFGESGYVAVQRRKTAEEIGGQFEPFYIRKVTNPEIVGNACVVFLCEGTSTASTGAAMAMLALNWDRWERVFGNAEFALVYDVEATKLEPNEPDDLIPENKPRLLAYWSSAAEAKMGKAEEVLTDVRWHLREE